MLRKVKGAGRITLPLACIWDRVMKKAGIGILGLDVVDQDRDRDHGRDPGQDQGLIAEIIEEIGNLFYFILYSYSRSRSRSVSYDRRR